MYGGRKLRQYDFNERRQWSEGFEISGIDAILLARIPGATGVRKATAQEDRQGTDYWVERENGLPPLSVDTKIREPDYSLKGKDDLALETYSVVPSKPGWTRDKSKRTDYVLWYWRDTGRFVLVPFPPLCAVFDRLWREWRETYGFCRQSSGAWQSECCYVPREIVQRSLVDWMNKPLGESDWLRLGHNPILKKLQAAWTAILQSIGDSDRKVAALLRDSAGPTRVDDQSVILTFSHTFHKEQIELPHNRAVVEAAMSSHIGEAVLIRCALATHN